MLKKILSATAVSLAIAKVMFQGQSAIKVRYVLTYRDGKIVDEIWQIDPKLVAY